MVKLKTAVVVCIGAFILTLSACQPNPEYIFNSDNGVVTGVGDETIEQATATEPSDWDEKAEDTISSAVTLPRDTF